MKLFAKTALVALLLGGATALTVAPAEARVSIGLGFGGYYPPPYYAYCDPYSRWYDPYRCDDYDGYDYYDGPVFIDGFWFNGPFRSRFHGGHREFYWHNSWHGGSGFHRDAFRHGGSARHDGGWGGHGGHRHH